MTRVRRPLIAGNWKMNGLRGQVAEIGKIAQGAGDLWRRLDLLVCPPATLLFAASATVLGARVKVGGQDCHAAASGAHTGDLSAEMLADVGAVAVIVGHSERRADHGESNEAVRAKAAAAWRAGLTAIVCVGETLAERDAGRALKVVGDQLAGSLPEGATAANLVVAYEPVWAIGTGRTPTIGDIAEVHGFIRSNLRDQFSGEAEGVRILYGGSVKPDNAASLLAAADVDGALVGGASLKADDFLAIANACPA
ncbi:MAG: triose-phosphate isomerase [Xanthobacteraceae bacterium]